MMRAWFLTAAALLAAGGCHLIGGAGDLIAEGIDDGGGGTPTTTSTSNTGGSDTTTGGGDMGGSGPMCDEALCSSNNSECENCECVDGLVCVCVPRPYGEVCSVGYCDGDSACVECLDNTDYGCDPTLSCDVASHSCISASCSDAIKNGSETDLNCGGSDCAPCGNGFACLGDGDCVSNRCVPGNTPTCMACSAHADCDADQYCEGQSCRGKKGAFGSCSDGAMCQSGSCSWCFGTCCSL